MFKCTYVRESFSWNEPSIPTFVSSFEFKRITSKGTSKKKVMQLNGQYPHVYNFKFIFIHINTFQIISYAFRWGGGREWLREWFWECFFWGFFFSKLMRIKSHWEYLQVLFKETCSSPCHFYMAIFSHIYFWTKPYCFLR